MIIKNSLLFRSACIVSTILFSFYFYGCFNSEQKQADEILEGGIDNIQKGNFDKGIKQFSKVLQIDPNNYPNNYLAYYHRGTAYRDIKDYKNAISDFNSCIEIDPNNSWAYFQLGGVWANQAKLEKAIDFYTQAIKVNPQHMEAYATRGIMEAMLGKVDQALEDLNAAIKIDPQIPMLFITKAQILELKGDCQAAVDNYEKGMSFDTKEFDTKGNIAWILAACSDNKFRNSEKALKMAYESLEIDSDKEYVYFRTIAAAYAEKEDFQNALIYQKKAIQSIQTVVKEDNLKKMYYDNELKKYKEQLEAYKNNRPWYLKKSE